MEDEIKYAIYIVAVEDTVEGDAGVYALPGLLTVDRLGGDLTRDAAADEIGSAVTINWDYAPLV